MNFNNNAVEARAFRLKPITSPKDNERYIPVVTALHQGQAAAGNNRNTQLQPAGKALAANGVSGESWKKDISKKPEEEKSFPVRLVVLLDISGSMNGGKLDLVKEKIKDLEANLKEKEIETIVIPFNQYLRKRSEHGSLSEAINRIESLEPTGCTNIYKPVNDATEALSGIDDDKRNLVLLISDGQHNSEYYSRDRHTEKDIIEKVKEFPNLDAGIYSVGVADGYNEELLRSIVEKVGFGGAVHIPEAKGEKPIFKTLLPAFINSMSSAPHFPVMKFNSWFDKVINLTPSMKNVERTDEGFNAAQGYQQDSYSVAFVKENQYEHAHIDLKVKNKASDKEVIESESRSLTIEDLDTAIGLDPSEREMIRDMPANALMSELINSKDLNGLKEFKDLNFHHFNKQTQQALLDALQTLEDHKKGVIDENTLRSYKSGRDSIIGSQSQIFHNPTLDSSSSARLPGDTLENKKAHDFTQKGLGDSSVSVLDSKPEGNYKEKLFQFNFNGKEYGLDEGENISIGRHPKNDLIITDSNISRHHASLYVHHGNLYLVDTHSRNGVFLNDEKIKAKKPFLVSDGDLIELCDHKLKVSKGF